MPFAFADYETSDVAGSAHFAREQDSEFERGDSGDDTPPSRRRRCRGFAPVSTADFLPAGVTPDDLPF